MEKTKKIKIFIGIIYLAIFSTFLYFLFQNFSFDDINSIKVIQANKDQLNLLKQNNLILLISIFFVFTVFWVFLLGFGSPIALVGGFIFGKWIGTIIITFSLSAGALCLYLLGKYFFYNILKDKLYEKFKSLNLMFQKRQLFVMIIFRFVGLVPFFLANLLPVIFNINAKNYFIGTFIGIVPSIFVISSLGSGISDAIYNFDKFPSLWQLISLQEIYLPLIGFMCILIISFFLKRKFK